MRRYLDPLLAPATLFAIALALDLPLEPLLMLLWANRSIVVKSGESAYTIFYVRFGFGADDWNFAFFAFAYALWPTQSGHRLDARTGRTHFLILFIALKVALSTISWLTDQGGLDAIREHAYASPVQIDQAMARMARLRQAYVLASFGIAIASSLLLLINIDRSLRDSTRLAHR